VSNDMFRLLTDGLPGEEKRRLAEVLHRHDTVQLDAAAADADRWRAQQGVPASADEMPAPSA